MTSSTDRTTVSSTTASGQRPHFWCQDEETRIVWVLPRDTELGRQYAQLNSKDDQITFMTGHGRNTGRLPPREECKPGKFEDTSEEYQALMKEWRKLGYLPGMDAPGNAITREEATRRRDVGYKAAQQVREAQEAREIQ